MINPMKNKFSFLYNLTSDCDLMVKILEGQGFRAESISITSLKTNAPYETVSELIARVALCEVPMLGNCITDEQRLDMESECITDEQRLDIESECITDEQRWDIEFALPKT